MVNVFFSWGGITKSREDWSISSASLLFRMVYIDIRRSSFVAVAWKINRTLYV